MKYHDYGSAAHWNDVLNREFAKESDRAAVILVGSLFDAALSTYIRNVLLPTATSSDELFDPANAPLASFSAKIAVAHRLGLISQKFCRDLHLIRKIRNDFAHNIHGCVFDTSSVRARILELAKSSGFIARNPKFRQTFPEGIRGDFLLTASWMLFCLNKKIEDADSIPEAKPEWGYNHEFVEEEN